MSDSSRAGGGSIGFVGLLTILFIGLKLTGYINWSWLWVLAPLWVSVLAVVVFALFAFVCFVIGACVVGSHRAGSRR